MGCLNSNTGFSHWFANLHFSGVCNRACYFCIGQHMQALDPIDNLNAWPLPGMDEFLEKCREHNIKEINLTGSNTDPLLYKHLKTLTEFLREQIPGAVLGIRTNGVKEESCPELLDLFDKASISITSFNPEIYKQTMGKGSPPNLKKMLARHPNVRFKANVVLCPETVDTWPHKGESPADFADLGGTLRKLYLLGFDTVNLREPYGQSHIGDPLVGADASWCKKTSDVFGMPSYLWGDREMKVTYWDVHYVEVESVNLYSNGIVSVTYPVTKGHCPDTGKVQDQANFSTGRHFQQWQSVKPKKLLQIAK